MFGKLAVTACAMAIAFGPVAAEAATFNFDFIAPLGFGSTDTYVGSGQLFGDEESEGVFRITDATGSMTIKDYEQYQRPLTGASGKITAAGNHFVAQSLELFLGQGGQRDNVSFTPLSNAPDTKYFVRIGEVAAPAGTLTITAATAAVPEPASWAMMIAGFGMTGLALRRRQRVHTTVAYA